MRCDNCQYWTDPPGDEFASAIEREFGLCSRVPHSEAVGAWDWEAEDCKWVLNPEYADRTAIARDGSGYHAHLETKAAHFCSMFKARETETS